MPFTKQQTNRNIREFQIDKENFAQFYAAVQADTHGENWPVVYLLHNDNYTIPSGKPKKLLYIGETTSAVRRMKEHFANTNSNYADRANLNVAHIIFDDTFNKSAILDIEQELIHLFSADSSHYELQNRNDGQSSQHQYYERDKYIDSLMNIWEELRQPSIKMAKDSFEDVRNSNLFKYSPYTALTSQQEKAVSDIVDSLIDAICRGKDYNAVISGVAGTGKTVVLIKALSELVHLAKIANGPLSSAGPSVPSASPGSFDDDQEGSEQVSANKERIKKLQKALGGRQLKVAYVVPLSELKKPFETVVKAVCGDASIVKNATEVANTHGQYDVIFVDEAHRLGTVRKFGANKNPYKKACSALGLKYTPGMVNPPTELNWIVEKSKCRVFVYDENQKVRCYQSIEPEHFNDVVINKSYTTEYELTAQMRCKAGDKYVKFLNDLFNNTINKSGTPLPPWNGYDFRVYDDVDQMVTDINAWNNPGYCGLSRVVAGYGWKWNDPENDAKTGSKTGTKGKGRHDIVNNLSHSNWDIHIGGYDYFWNAQDGNFIFKADRNEIGCVHTVQGFDLNYVGVIFGPEIKYDSRTGFSIDKTHIFDSGAKIKDEALCLQLTLRAYKVMMERGIRGCYVYACDPGLQEYLKQHIPSPDTARQNLDMRVNKGIDQLTGIDVSSNGTPITDNKIQLNKAEVDNVVSGKGGLGVLKSITIDNVPYDITGISLSEDNDYYVFSIHNK